MDVRVFFTLLLGLYGGMFSAGSLVEFCCVEQRINVYSFISWDMLACKI